jgi:hypothetical protein
VKAAYMARLRRLAKTLQERKIAQHLTQSHKGFRQDEMRHTSNKRFSRYHRDVAETTRYFRERILAKRPYLTLEMCEEVISRHVHREVQADGRIRFWAQVAELNNRFVRVVTLEDAVTIHNAFLDRRFRRPA